MNIELGKGAVIALIVVALLVVGLVFMKVSKPAAVEIPKDFNPYASGPGAPSPQ